MSASKSQTYEKIGGGGQLQEYLWLENQTWTYNYSIHFSIIEPPEITHITTSDTYHFPIKLLDIKISIIIENLDHKIDKYASFISTKWNIHPKDDIGTHSKHISCQWRRIKKFAVKTQRM